MPLALSINAAMGDVPIKLPIILDKPSTQNAKVCLGNSFFAFMKPAKKCQTFLIALPGGLKYSLIPAILHLGLHCLTPRSTSLDVSSTLDHALF